MTTELNPHHKKSQRFH